AYIDRILKGENPADLPIQAPTSTSWSLASRRRGRLGSLCHPRCLHAPTRSSSKLNFVAAHAYLRGIRGSVPACRAALRAAKVYGVDRQHRRGARSHDCKRTFAGLMRSSTGAAPARVGCSVWEGSWHILGAETR